MTRQSGFGKGNSHSKFNQNSSLSMESAMLSKALHWGEQKLRAIHILSKNPRAKNATTIYVLPQGRGYFQKLLSSWTNDKKRCRTKLKWSTKTTKASWI
jgi:hypothetical protein